jgi:hypothetical protein
MMQRNEFYLKLLITKLFDMAHYDNRAVKWSHNSLIRKTVLIWVNMKDERIKNNFFSMN